MGYTIISSVFKIFF